MIQPNIEIVAGQPNESAIADGLGRIRGTIMGSVCLAISLIFR